MSRFSYFIAALCVLGRSSVIASVTWSGAVDRSLGIGPGEYIYALDMNADSVDDFMFHLTPQMLFFDPVNGNAGITHQVGDGPPSHPIYHNEYVPLNTGTLIENELDDPSHFWWGGEDMLVGYMGFFESLGNIDFAGSFMNTSGYLGVSFDIEGSTHYGWIRLSHDLYAPNGGYYYLTLHDWAWETEPNTPIVAGAVPEPATALLFGFGGLSTWLLRRRLKQKQDLG